MWRSWSALELSAAFAVCGSVVAVAVPAFVKNLAASKLTEPVDGLERIVVGALAYSEARPHELSFPPSAPLTPAEVPRGVRAADPPDAWEHLTWRSLGFRFEDGEGNPIPHAFAFRFDSALDPATNVFRFTATAHGDLDGDGLRSTFEVRGERLPGQPARVLPGMLVESEVE